MFLLSFAVLLLLYVGSVTGLRPRPQRGRRAGGPGADAAPPARAGPPLAAAEVQARWRRGGVGGNSRSASSARAPAAGRKTPTACGGRRSRAATRRPWKMVHEAMEMRTTDIHLEPTQGGDDGPLPHRRHPPGVRPVQPGHGRFGPEHLQGAGRPRHHREAQAAGRQLFRRGPQPSQEEKEGRRRRGGRSGRAARAGIAAGRLPRGHGRQRRRRKDGHAHPRPRAPGGHPHATRHAAEDARADPPDGHASRTACSSSAARPAPAKAPPSTPACRRSTATRRTSSPSRTRSSTTSPT